jgi:hypothetical protein
VAQDITQVAAVAQAETHKALAVTAAVEMVAHQ